ncbi:ABC transporter permease [Bailinhaonella thermotolerans]|uniref:ABC transporter permease n=1 Tax=Bailinhaonella thermotolerans TaxID=1070861 RepID=A0A3A4BBV8_9ACTN|nr:ABC transporter permease [Bailinhaonella thermotolerans]RJL36013.1 ABC transporter permease [Bailinhaonella thermotolerans]
MSLQVAESAIQQAEHADEAGGGLWREAFRRLVRKPAAIIGAIFVAIFVIVAVFAPLIAPYSPTATDLSQIKGPGHIPGPSSTHWLGLDDLGRDVFSRMIYGARQSLVVGVVSMAFGMVGGIILGLLAGGLGGWVDATIMRFVDMMLAIPGLLFAIGIAAMLGQSLVSVMIAIGVVNIPVFARLLRGQMLAQREADYALAAKSLGVKRSRIILGHVFPNSLSPVIVQGTLTLATAIIEAAGLAFLGLSGADPAIPEWGRMLADTQKFLTSAPQLVFYPGIAIVLSALGFTLLGESLREALDPKNRR